MATGPKTPPSTVVVEVSPPRERVSLGELVRRIATAEAVLVGGLAEAVGRGVHTFASHLTEENVDRLGFSNGFVKGAFEGTLSTLEESPKVLRRAYDILASREDTSQAAPMLVVPPTDL